MSIPLASQFAGTVKLEPSLRDMAPSPGSNLQLPSIDLVPRDMMLQKIFGANFTPEQYQMILSAYYPTTGQPLFDVANYDTVIEIINLLRDTLLDRTKTFDDVITALRTVIENSDMDLVWSMPSLDNTRRQVEHEYKLSVEQPEGSAYTGPCKNKGCTSTLFNTFSEQTRGWDEGATNKATCIKCKTTFKI
jgi:DNA-directed RNA polymerase subunit M/transcription elongation factor TFIIS